MTLTELEYIVAVIPEGEGEGPRLRGSTRRRESLATAKAEKGER
jgi:hypothetical protein